jgi:hypothetical protein
MSGFLIKHKNHITIVNKHNKEERFNYNSMILPKDIILNNNKDKSIIKKITNSRFKLVLPKYLNISKPTYKSLVIQPKEISYRTQFYYEKNNILK